MILKFLGTRGYVDEKSNTHKNRSSLLLITNRSRILIDFGDEYEPDLLEQIKPDAIVITHCYDAETEALTRRGWLRFEEINEEDEICTLNKDGFIEYQRPTEIIRQFYKGKMYRLKTKYIDLKVTPHHKRYVKT